MDVSVEQMSLVKRFLLSVHLSHDVTGTEIVDEDTLHLDASLLGPSGCNHQRYHHHADDNHEGIGESGEIVADIEEEA